MRRKPKSGNYVLCEGVPLDPLSELHRITGPMFPKQEAPGPEVWPSRPCVTARSSHVTQGRAVHTSPFVVPAVRGALRPHFKTQAPPPRAVALKRVRRAPHTAPGSGSSIYSFQQRKGVCSRLENGGHAINAIRSALVAPQPRPASRPPCFEGRKQTKLVCPENGLG